MAEAQEGVAEVPPEEAPQRLEVLELGREVVEEEVGQEGQVGQAQDVEPLG